MRVHSQIFSKISTENVLLPTEFKDGQIKPIAVNFVIRGSNADIQFVFLTNFRISLKKVVLDIIEANCSGTLAMRQSERKMVV
jgi:hypothetical protein